MRRALPRRPLPYGRQVTDTISDLVLGLGRDPDLAKTREIINNLVGAAQADLRQTPEDGGGFQGGQGHGQDLIVGLGQMD